MHQIQSYKWKDKDLLGQGGFGKVYKATDLRQSQTELNCAIKLVDSREVFSEPILNQLFKYEQKALKVLKGEHTVTALDIIIQKPTIYIVMDLQTMDLRKEMLKRQNRPYDEEKAISIMQDLLKGMHVMVENQFVHRDLKPENVFIKDNKYKIADFGFCQPYKEKEVLSLCCGTPGYMSPQIIAEENYTNKCDIWSIGVIYYEILLGQYPGKGSSDEERIQNIQQKGIEFPSRPRISHKSREFIINCLKVDESKRWGWNEVFESELNLFNNDSSEQGIDQIQTNNTQHIEPANQETLGPKERQFLMQMQSWIKGKGDEGVDIIMSQYFPRGEINMKEFSEFCANSKMKNINLQSLFNFFDFERDGTITKKEFNYRINSTDYTKTVIDQDPQQLKLMVMRVIKQINLEIVKQNLNLDDIFDQINSDQENGISLAEFHNFVSQLDDELTPYEIGLVFRFIDTNNDKDISKQEFKNIIENKQLYEKRRPKKNNNQETQKSMFSCFNCVLPKKNKYKQKETEKKDTEKEDTEKEDTEKESDY